MTDLRMLAEEQAGTIEYLKGRVQELGLPAPVDQPSPAAPKGPEGAEAPDAVEGPLAPVPFVGEGPFDAIEAESDVAGIFEARLDELAEGQTRLAKRLDEIESRLLAPDHTARRRRWG
jgi:hypothetical protein